MNVKSDMHDTGIQFFRQMIQYYQDKIKKLFFIEYLRYKDKGLMNVLTALTLLIIIVVSTQRFGEYIWPQEIQHKQMFVILISCTIHFCFQIVCFFIYYPGYAGLSKSYEKYRINKGVKKPWKYEEWPALRRRLFFYLGINYVVMYPLLISMSIKISGLKLRFHDFPSISEIVWQLIFVSFVEDCFFYWNHRISHQFKFLYKFHKVHHQYTETFSLVTEFTHPVDYLFGILIPSAMPFILLGSRAHCFMFFVWQFYKMFVSTEGHSGYEFPWSPTRIFFFVSGPSLHDFHHSKNIGTYCGSIYLWDHFNDSSEVYFGQRYPEYKQVVEKKVQ